MVGKKLAKIGGKIYLALIFIFLYAPIATLIVLSFNESKFRGKWGGFSLKWYESLFASREIMEALWTTLLLAFLSALIATILGTMVSFAMNRMKKLPRMILMTVTNIPMLNADIVTGISLMLLFIALRYQMGFGSVLIAHITFNLPYVVLSVLPKLKQMNKSVFEAALDLGASRQYAFPVIGGPSVGKTCFINMAIDQMMSDVAPARSWKMSFISDTEEKDHALAMKSLNQGVRLMKTELNSLTAYQLMLKLPNEKIGRRIYVYDISGEMFSSSSDVQNNLAYSYANGFIFIIDPLTLNQFAMDVEDKVDLNAYGASSKDFDDILNIMLINLEKMFGLKDKDTLKRNLAVVINKVDIPTLEEKIGETAAQQYLAENAKTCKSYMDARDAVCRNFLEEYGAGNFVRTAEAKFKTVRYFTCSALGHNHEGQPYEGK